MRSDSDIIALAWDDKASFEMIEDQTGLSEKGIIKLMRRSLRPGSFRKWRERVSGRPAKHAKRSLNALAIDYANLQWMRAKGMRKAWKMDYSPRRR